MSEKIIDMAAVKKRKAVELSESNERTYRELKEFTGGQFSMNAADLRREMFFDHLVEAGILPEESRWDFEIKFQSSIEDTLKEQFTMAREAKAEVGKKKLAVVKEDKKLIVPRGGN